MTATSVPLATHLFLLVLPAAIVVASLAAYLFGRRHDR
jgi:hypothetical protein